MSDYEREAVYERQSTNERTEMLVELEALRRSIDAQLTAFVERWGRPAGRPDAAGDAPVPPPPAMPSDDREVGKLRRMLDRHGGYLPYGTAMRTGNWKAPQLKELCGRLPSDIRLSDVGRRKVFVLVGTAADERAHDEECAFHVSQAKAIEAQADLSAVEIEAPPSARPGYETEVAKLNCHYYGNARGEPGERWPYAKWHDEARADPRAYIDRMNDVGEIYAALAACERGDDIVDAIESHRAKVATTPVVLPVDSSQ